MIPRAATRLAIVCALLLAASWPALPARQADDPARFPHRPGEVILKFNDSATAASRQRILADLGARQTRSLRRIRADLSRITRLGVEEALARYRGHPDVDFIEPNYLYAEAAVPGDSRFDEQWSLNNTGQTGGSPGADIAALPAWDLFTGSGEIVVAVIDSGIDREHPDLAANIWVHPGEIPGNGQDDDGNGLVDDVHGWDFLNDDADPADDRGHGTHVAGTVGAVGDNDLGVTGVAWRVRLMPLKFLGADGYGSAADAVDCIDYATRMGAALMNNSWGGGGYSEALRRAIERAAGEGVLFVAAAGNLGVDTDGQPFYPAAYDLPNVISVAATDHDDQLADFSNYGATSVDLAAPGAGILSTLPGEIYGHYDGTSMAAPHVSGVLALILDRHRQLDAAGARALLLDRVDLLPGLAGRVATGGRLNALRALAGSDDSPPAAVSDLRTAEADGQRIDLVWTASGDDGSQGAARRYDVRRSSAPIDEAGFALARTVPGAPRPAQAGATERMTVSGLDFDTEYHFAVKVIDELGNSSPVSNDAAGRTLRPPALAPSVAGLHAELRTGERALRDFALHNDGAGEARYELFVEGPPRSGGVSLLILGSGINTGPLRTDLEHQLGIARVEAIDASAPALSLATLLDHDAVLLAIKSPPPDAVALGNLLADYADTGSGLILTLATMVHGWEVAGRLLDEGYLPFTLGSGPAGSSELGSHDPSHPLMDGVSLLRGELLARLQPAPGATLVASWADDQPLLATQGANVVGVNVFLEDGAWFGDIPRLLRNAALWSARRAAWLTAEPASGTVGGGDAGELLARFDAGGLDGGDYTAEVVVRSNDPERPRLRVPAALRVIAAPDIELWGAPLEFGEQFIAIRHDLYLFVLNRGFEPLTVGAISADRPEFVATPDSFVVAPGENRLVTVSFTPPAAGPVAGTLTFLSDDPDEGSVVVPVSGVGVAPPSIELSPELLVKDLFVGQRATFPLGLRNAGGSELSFDLVVRGDLVVPDGSWSFHDGFEDGEFDGWFDAGGGGFKEVTAETAAAGSARSFTDYGSPTPLAHYDGIYTRLDETRPSYVGFWVRSGSVATHDGYFTLRDDENRLAIYFFARATGHFVVNSTNGGDATFRYLPETWYHVEFRSIDWEAGSFDYYVDGRRIAEGASFANAAADRAGRIDLYNLTRGARAWWDEIRVLAEEPPRWIAAEPWSGLLAAGGHLDVAVALDAASLPLGQVEADIHVRSNDMDRPEAIVPVLLRVHEPPHATLEPERLEAALPPRAERTATRTVQVGNEGGSDLVWEIEAAPYVTAEPASGRVAPGEVAEVRLVLSSLSLDEGDHLSEVVLRSNDPLAAAPAIPLTLHAREIELEDLRVNRAPRSPDAAGTVEVMLQLPAPYNPRDVLVSTVSLWDEVYAIAAPVIVGDGNRDGRPDLTLRFDRVAFEKSLPRDGAVGVTIRGEVDSRTWFRGQAILRHGLPTGSKRP